jgi:hypothetical protein
VETAYVGHDHDVKVVQRKLMEVGGLLDMQLQA